MAGCSSAACQGLRDGFRSVETVQPKDLTSFRILQDTHVDEHGGIAKSERERK